MRLFMTTRSERIGGALPSRINQTPVVINLMIFGWFLASLEDIAPQLSSSCVNHRVQSMPVIYRARVREQPYLNIMVSTSAVSLIFAIMGEPNQVVCAKVPRRNAWAQKNVQSVCAEDAGPDGEGVEKEGAAMCGEGRTMSITSRRWITLSLSYLLIFVRGMLRQWIVAAHFLRRHEMSRRHFLWWPHTSLHLRLDCNTYCVRCVEWNAFRTSQNTYLFDEVYDISDVNWNN